MLWRVLLLCRKQSIDLENKLINWFPLDGRDLQSLEKFAKWRETSGLVFLFFLVTVEMLFGNLTHILKGVANSSGKYFGSKISLLSDFMETLLTAPMCGVVSFLLTWPFVNLGIGTSALEFGLELELILKTPLFPLPQGLSAPNLAGLWLRMKGPHPQSHVTLRHQDHVINKKGYVSAFTRPMDLKRSRVVT